MKLLLCGGGTAGHITPAIAIAEELKSTSPSSEVLFIGRENGNENNLIEKSGFSYKTIKVEGIKRSLSLDNVKRISNAIKSIKKAKEIIEEFNPDVILGTGGYVSWPVIMAGKKLGIKTAIHESNIIPGLTTRLLSKKCDIIFINKNETKTKINTKSKILTVGNPLRKNFLSLDRATARKKLGLEEKDFLIVSFGGSIGSEKLNEIIIDVIKNYSSKESDIKHIHAVGNRYKQMEILSKKTNGGCKIVDFIEDMPKMMRAADLVICRCGAITLSEICEVGVTPILIPSPNVTDNHQYANGSHLSSLGGAILIEEKNLSTSELISTIKSVKNDKFGRKNRAKILQSIATPNSAKTIVKELVLLKNEMK
jgi:UDP-N-acetylglucosamine--N-acetylmuramyl-(pentapeptide) pyrophosphoryl-undecaprenol N-acetylglucosamine transferase